MRIPQTILLVTAAVLAMVTAAAGAEGRFEAVRARIGADPGAPGVQPLYRELAVEALVTRRLPEGLETLVTVFTKALKSKQDEPTEGELAVLLRAADAFILMAHTQESGAGIAFRRDVSEWLFGSEGRLRTFLDIITPQDDWPAMYAIVAALHDHDSPGRDEFRRLILAMALVWDQPRPEPHPQMGGGQLPYDAAITDRYDYFRDLYASKRADIAYGKLSVAALTNVVDTPVPLSELRWVRKHVRPTHWERKFSAIRYDADRLERAQYQWPHGPYTLEAIEKKGGICTDQAYYAALCARAYGVPALLFVGEGRRGGHAWFGYMKGAEKWELDIGRYAYDKFATGYALNPQTNQPLSDHTLNFLCDRALREESFSDAARLGRLAFVLRELGYLAAARQAAERSVQRSPLYELPWLVQERMLEEAKDWAGLAALLSRKAAAFRKYPDYSARIAARQAEVLRTLGDHAGADRLLARNVRAVERGRDDLARSLVSEKVRAAYEKGDYRSAREQMEDLLKDQKDEGQKLAELLGGYLELTKETKQTAEAVRFLKRYLGTLERRFGDSDRNRAILLRVLLTAHENNGDGAEAARIRRQLEKLEP
jgi:hypothetical protein